MAFTSDVAIRAAGGWSKEEYDLIAKPIFRGIRAQRLLLEYDDERSGSFEPLKEIPDDKIAVLGLVTTKTPRRETMEALTARIKEASQFVPLEQLALSPQCGFCNFGPRQSHHSRRSEA